MTCFGNGNPSNSNIIGQILQAQLAEIRKIETYDYRRDGDNLPRVTLSAYSPPKTEPNCFSVPMYYKGGGSGGGYDNSASSAKNIGHFNVSA